MLECYPGTRNFFLHCPLVLFLYTFEEVQSSAEIRKKVAQIYNSDTIKRIFLQDNDKIQPKPEIHLLSFREPVTH